MELKNKLCESCGGDLRQISEEQYKCEFCRYVYDSKEVMRYADKLHKLLDELKIEAISNARRNLYEAVNAEYVSSKRVHECCVILKQLLPDDFQASFYEIATGNNVKQLTRAIRRINVEENMPYIDGIVRFLLRSFQTEYQLELNNLIAKAYEKTNPEKFEEYCTMLADEAVKVDNGVYETKLPREVFVAYSSKDMDAVSELTEALESQGLKCFVAARNLRHGKGAVENYNSALEEAMRSCRSVVFVSSPNSRSFNCDALTIELPYLRERDLATAPAEYQNNYKAVPQKYKKPRVEYCIGARNGGNGADVISNEFFDGYERAYSPDEVAARLVKQLVAVPAPTPKKEEPPKPKYCISCLKECPQDAKFCSYCGESEFADTQKEAELKKQIRALEQQKAELEKVNAPSKASELAQPSAVKKEKNTQKGNTKAVKTQSNHQDSVGLRIELNRDGCSCSVLGIGSCKDTNVVIPSVHKGKPVEFIEIDAFKGCSKLTSITIPDSVMSIGHDAFTGCSNLTSIIIPNSVISIGNNAFSGCSNLKSITIPSSVTSIGLFAFSGCSNLASITISNNVTSIKGGVFEGCSNLASITIPDSVTSIGHAAFSGCSNLARITIPSSVTRITRRAFEGCVRLSEIAFEVYDGWENGWNDKISEDVFKDPRKAANALKTTYLETGISRR